MNPEEGDKKMKHCIAFPLALLLCCLTMAACAEFIVGTEISEGDIRNFYYVYDTPFAESVYQKYWFHEDKGSKFFYHESRQGGSWPLTEENIVASGTVALTDEQWNAFFDLLRGGTVNEPDNEVQDGDSGPWMHLYWTGDNGKYREFSFASYDKLLEFEEYCTQLAQNHILTRFYFSRGGYMMPQTYEVYLKDGSYYLCENNSEPRLFDASFAADLLKCIKEYDLESWDGFHESDPYVLDGEGFTLVLRFADGTTVSASGDNAFPENYYGVTNEIEAIFEKEKMAQIAGTYRYEGEGFGGDFTITLNADGTYTFYEGYLSSYLGGGSWDIYYNAIYMTEENGLDLKFMFGVEDGTLTYIKMNSDDFPYVEVADGERFVRK